MKGVNAYIHKTCEKRLMKGEPLLFADLTNTDDCVNSLFDDLSELTSKKNDI
jgi:hypothetical protein